MWAIEKHNMLASIHSKKKTIAIIKKNILIFDSISQTPVSTYVTSDTIINTT